MSPMQVTLMKDQRGRVHGKVSSCEHPDQLKHVDMNGTYHAPESWRWSNALGKRKLFAGILKHSRHRVTPKLL